VSAGRLQKALSCPSGAVPASDGLSVLSSASLHSPGLSLAGGMRENLLDPGGTRLFLDLSLQIKKDGFKMQG